MIDRGQIMEMKRPAFKAVRIILPLPDPKLNAHNTGHWRSKAKPTKNLRALAKSKCTCRHKWAKATVTYRFYFANNRRRDAANCIQSMKPAIDGIVDAGLIPDDSWQFLNIAGVECYIDRENPRTELIFRKVE